jgi:hypothetical protein
VERIIITVKRQGESQEYDLELPADLSAEALVRELSLIWGWKEAYEVYAQPPGRLLAPHETLAQAGVWDGARLLLQPPDKGKLAPQRAAVSSQTPSPLTQEGPVVRWRPLGVAIEQPPAEPESPPSSGGYTWKRVDQD